MNPSSLIRVAAVAVALLAAPGLSGAEETTSIEDILEVLRAQGLIDEDTHTKILTKHHAQESRRADVAATVLDGWDVSGDLRLRHESFWFDEDDLGDEATNRYRMRYRARLKLVRQINDWLGIGFRVVSGGDDPRSTNQTLGSGPDFDTDDLRLDQAWAAITPKLGIEDVDVEVVGGKFSNPFTWKVGKDFLVWDNDITLEGAYLGLKKHPNESLTLFSNAGYFVADENSSSSDPKVMGMQIGATVKASQTVELGARATGYAWHSLDSDFVMRATEFGNLTTAFDDSKTTVGELSAYVRSSCLEDWPVTVYGTYARNFEADGGVVGGVDFGDESDAWLAGIEVGDKKKLVKLGFLYGEIEANSLVAQFIDSDFTDGYTNRKGWGVYGARQVAKNVDLNVTLFNADVLEDDVIDAGAPYLDSAADADRWRLQTDFVIKFD